MKLLHKPRRTAQSGLIHHVIPIIAFIILFGAIGTYVFFFAHAATSGTPELLSGITGGYCLNDPGDDLNSGSELNTALCNGSTDQQFQVAGTKIELGTANCLSPLGRATTIGTTVVLDHCHNYVAQNWSQNSSGQFINTNSGNCLSATGGIAGALLSIQSCNSHKAQKWTIGTYGSGGGGGGGSAYCSDAPTSEGTKVCAMAVSQYAEWQAGTMSPGFSTCNDISATSTCSSYAKYSDNNDEEWCADFISWVYRSVGHSFSGGQDGGWRLSNVTDFAGQLGFTVHSVSSGYIPQPGDIEVWGSEHADIVVRSDGTNPWTIGGDEEGGGNPDTNIVDQIQYNSPATEYVSPN